MIGRFLELSLATPDPAASLHFYTSLGFAPLAVNDSWPHAYCALGDGQIVLGLHGPPARGPQLSFVHAGLLRHRSALERAGFPVLGAQVGDADFNRLLLQDSDGHALQILEARTCSPPGAPVATLGTLLGWSMPSRDLDSSAAFWERAGLVAFAELPLPWPHRPLTGDGLNLALHRPEVLPEPVLVYLCTDLGQQRAFLDGRGLDASPWVHPATGRGALLRAPEGTAVLLLEEMHPGA